MDKDKFKSLKELQTYIRKGNILYDIVYINNIPYTMDYYDRNGTEVTFGNKKQNKGFIIETEDRYKKGYKDAIIEEQEPLIRNDISYYE